VVAVGVRRVVHHRRRNHHPLGTHTVTALSQRMRDAANTIEELNQRYDFGDAMPWEPNSLRDEAGIVAAEEHETP
jgi:hypothetical protein